MGVGGHKGERPSAGNQGPDDDSSSSGPTGDALPHNGGPTESRRPGNNDPGEGLAMDPTSAYIQDETQRIRALVEDIKARGHDVNIVLSAPVCVGIEELANEFARKVPGFRSASNRNQNVTPQSVISAMDSCDSLRRESLSQLAVLLSDHGVYAPSKRQSAELELVASLSQPSMGGSNNGSRRGSRISMPGGSTSEMPSQAEDVVARQSLEPLISSIATTLYCADIRRNIECLRGSVRRVPGAAPTPRTPANPPATVSSASSLTATPQRLRVFSGSILDATNVPTIANKEFRILDKWSLITIEQMGEVAWGEFTGQCPSHSTIYVYLYFDDNAYASIYDKYRHGRTPEAKTEMNRLQSFWIAQKRAADNLYHAGTNPMVVSRYYVMVLNCHNLQLTNPCTQLYIIDQVLSVVNELQSETKTRLWGAQSREADRKEFINSTEWLRKRFRVVPETIISPNAPWKLPDSSLTGRRRSSIDGDRPTKLVLNDAGRRPRGGSFDGSSISNSSTSSSESSGGGSSTYAPMPTGKVRIGGGITPLAASGVGRGLVST